MKKEFVDYLEQPIEIGNFVVGYQSKNGVPEVYEVMGFKPKTIALEEINTREEKCKKPKQVIVIEPHHAGIELPQPITDALGREIDVGDNVISSDGEYIDIMLYEVTEVLEHKVKLQCLTQSFTRNGTRYGHDLLKVEGEQVTFAILKSAHKS